MGPRDRNAGPECGTGSSHDAARRKRESGYTGDAETPATGTPGAGAPAPPALEVSGLSFAFGRKRALEDVGLTLGARQFNGAAALYAVATLAVLLALALYGYNPSRGMMSRKGGAGG